MSAIDEIMELVKHPFADVKVLTPAQIVFLSLVIFVGVLGYMAYMKIPIGDAALMISGVGAVVTGLFLAVYSYYNKKKGNA